MAGTVVQVPDRKGDGMREVTKGGVLHWGREGTDVEGDEHSEMTFFREQIRKAFGGNAPRVLDPFAGGGAIPLEAMRLGCDVVASDLNPVAWFILRCTLHYPNLLAGQDLPLPEFALKDREFVTSLLKARGAKSKAALRNGLSAFGFVDDAAGSVKGTLVNVPADIAANLAWHVQAWGGEVLRRARQAIGDRYPTYAYFEPVRRKGRRKVVPEKPFKERKPQLLQTDTDGAVSTCALNAEFDPLYLKDDRNPRWIAKPTVAYLWARTIRCGRCRTEIPLLKTRWLSRKDGKRVLLTVAFSGDRTTFGVNEDPAGASDGKGTMSESGVRCPRPECRVVTTMEDLRATGRAGGFGERMMAVVMDGQLGKEYRLPTEAELAAAQTDPNTLGDAFTEIPFGMPDEPTANEDALGMRIARYGFDSWRKLFTGRQLLALGVLAVEARKVMDDLERYPKAWQEAIVAYLAGVVSKVADYNSAVCSWHNGRETIGHTFARFALPMVWDYCEANPLSETTGGFSGMLEWSRRVITHALTAVRNAHPPTVVSVSAIEMDAEGIDVICTDPPYYDAIPYSDLMDFFQVWLRRILLGLSPEMDGVFAAPLGPKWDGHDGELIDDASRFGGDRQASKQSYEDGMARAFLRFHHALRPAGRLVVVFASKSPDAWETLVSALIRAGFVVDGSWPIQTEMQNRQRSQSSAALSSSIWLVCKKRSPSARPGWDTRVLADMQANITEQLREFWDNNIRGPDFVWAATGPALEAFSRHPVVKRTDAQGERMTVADFLRHVRRMVVAFVVSRIFHAEGGATEALDDPTTYYLLHRNDFGLSRAPAGACILYALSCGISDADLLGGFDILARSGRRASDDADDSGGSGKGSEFALKRWDKRKAKDLGEPTIDGRPPPLIDCVHRLMQLWKTGEQGKVDAYLKARSLWTNELFAQVLQALIELADVGSDERSTLEYIQSHVTARGQAPAPPKLKI